MNEATYDTLKNITVESGNTSSGAIVFGTSTATTNLGNSFNGILNCTVRDRSDAAGVPANLIYSSGTAVKLNASNTVYNCQLFNFTTSGVSITATGNGDNWVINNNHFYQTASRSTVQSAINISSGIGHQIHQNYIGGSTINCGGTPWTNTGNVTVKGITISSTVGSPISIQGNVIQNISLSGASSTFYGIETLNGSFNIGTTEGNTIGDPNGSSDIALAGNTTNVGIKNNSSASVSIWNNNIYRITCTSTGTSSTFIGIWHAGTGSSNIYNNTLDNLRAVSSKTSIDAMALQGIYVSGAATGGVYITENKISNLLLNNTGAVQNNVAGISITAVANPIINRNKIWNINNKSTKTTATAPPTASGISIYTPSASSVVEIRNNMISLGNGATTNTEFNGIWLQSSTNAYTAKIYYNSILISGSPSSGALSSFALLRGNNSTTTQGVSLDIKNNIFANTRKGGTGKHYCLGNQGTSPTTNWSNVSDANLFISPNGTNIIALWNTSDLDINSLRTNSNGETTSLTAMSNTTTNADSINVANLFNDINSGDLHINGNNSEAWFVNGKGNQITINNDIDNNSRSTTFVNGTTDIGCDEVNVTAAPIIAKMVGSIANGNTTEFWFGSIKFGQITWHGSNLPTAVNFTIFSQKYPDLTDGLGNPYNNLIGAQYSNIVFEISPVGGDINTYTYDLRLYFNKKYVGTIDDLSAISIAKNPYIYPTPSSTPVNDYGIYSTVSDAGNTYYEISDVIGFSHFIFYKGTATPLPVNLVNFSGRCNNGDVDLTWITASETNNHYFVVEKSTDAINFNAIAQIQGAGNSNTMLTYNYTDKNALSQAVNYYRLKQVDYDGKSTTSEIIAVQCNDINENYVRIGNSENYITLLFNSSISGKINVQVFDKIGRCVISKQYEGEEITTLPIEKQSLSTGIYIIVVQSSQGTLSKKVVVVK